MLFGFDHLGEHDLAAGDVTGDGIPDLVTSMHFRAGLAVRAGRGDGTFDPYMLTPLKMTLLGIELADMNGDGNLDVVSLVQRIPGVVVSLGDGHGGFLDVTQRLETPRNTVDVHVADLDGDGYRDLITAGGYSSDSRIIVMRGLGGRAFAAPELTPLLDPGGTGVQGLHVVDLNADSLFDVVAVFGGSVQSALGTGNGGFALPWSVSPVPTPGLITHVADATGDGIPDLIGSFAGAVHLLPGLGDGTFGAAIVTPVAGVLRIAATGDLNGDGFTDLGLWTNSGITHALNDGSEGFAASGAFIAGDHCAIGDVTGDGRADLVGTSYGETYCGGGTLLCGTLAVRVQNSDGTLEPWAARPWAQSVIRGITDLNGDSRGDLVLWEGAALSVALARSDGGFDLQPGYGIGGEVASRVHTLADLDDDGHLDLLVCHETDIHVFYGRVSGPLVGIALPEHRPVSGTRILAAYPNPARGRLEIRFASAEGGAADIALFDLGGRRRHTITQSSIISSGENVTSALTSALQPGVYFLRVVTPSGSDTRRVVLLD